MSRSSVAVPVCLIVFLFIAAPLAGQAKSVTPDPDILGIYFDLDANVYLSYTSAPLELMNAYLLISNPSDAGGVAAWECLARVQGDAALQQWELSAGLNILDTQLGEFHVAIGMGASALPAAPTILLATWSGYVATPRAAVMFHVEPYPGSASFTETPGYVSGEDDGRFIPLGSTFGDYFQPCAAINPYGTPAESMGWGDIKALFR